MFSVCSLGMLSNQKVCTLEQLPGPMTNDFRDEYRKQLNWSEFQLIQQPSRRRATSWGIWGISESKVTLKALSPSSSMIWVRKKRSRSCASTWYSLQSVTLWFDEGQFTLNVHECDLVQLEIRNIY